MRNAGSYRAARRNAARAEANAKKKTLAAVWPSPAKPLDMTRPARVNRSEHPGANPAHNPAGRKRWTAKVLDPATQKLVEVKMRGPRNPSRWLPHSSNREAERRLARMG